MGLEEIAQQKAAALEEPEPRHYDVPVDSGEFCSTN